MSDAQSLTLPKPGSLTRAKRRRRKLPPNWRWIALALCWSAGMCLWNLLSFPSDHNPFDLLAAVMFGVDVAMQLRRLGRPDGGYRFAQEDRMHFVVILGAWLVLVVRFLTVVL